MLTGNEPISAANLKAALGAGRTLSITSGSAYAHDKGGKEMRGALDHAVLGGSADFSASGGTLTCVVPGDYLIRMSAMSSIIGNSDGNTRLGVKLRISRGSSSVEIPVASMFAAKAEGRSPNKSQLSGVSYAAHLEQGDRIEVAYEYISNEMVGSAYCECEVSAGYYIERTR